MSKIIISEYKPENRDEWEKFVNESNNGTMFHKQAFLDYHNPGKFPFKHFMFRKDGELVAVLPGGTKENETVYWSPMGASYGSIVTKDISFELSLEIVDSLMEYFRENKYKEVFLIPPPLIYTKNLSQHIEYALLYRKFDFELHYISHAIQVRPGEDYFGKFDKKAQNIIKKIKRDGKIRMVESEDYAAYYPILEENKAKHNVKPTHSLEDLLKLKELMPEHLKLFITYYEDKPIGGTLMFLANSKVALCFYQMLLYDYKKYRPIFLGLDETVKWSVENGYEWFDIGVSQDTAAEDPMTPSLDLIYFKERFGARGILRSTYHYKFSD